MSDMLNEKFAEFVSEQNVVLAEGDPMPTVTAAVLPANPAAPGGGISGEPNRAKGGSDPQPSVGTEVAPSGQSVTDNGGPRPDGNDEGEDNPGAKAAAPVGAKAAQSDGTAQTANINDAGDQGTTPSVGAEVAYGTSKGPDVSYPIKPSYESVDVSDDVNALLEGTELSEEFAEKAKTIFEAAIKAKMSEEYDKLVEHFANELDKQVAAARAELSEEVNGTMNYAIGQWMESNQVAVDRGIRNEITEDFIAGLKNLFEEHYISIPDDKVDAVEGMADTIREMEERLDEQVKANVKLQNRLNESAKKVIVNTVSEGLVDTQKDKLATLAEGVDFVSEEEYTKKVKALKESYFPNAPVVREETEEAPVEEADVSPAMAAYLSALNRWSN
tara:strand:- start:315 stop:1475 length:1161 start_codon:yes stop_codon:yes gene_type:complete